MSRLSLGISLLGLLLVLASCGTEETDEPTLLGPTIAAPAVVTAWRDGIVASVPQQIGGTYEWSIEGGELQEGQGTHSIVFAAAGPGSLELSVRIVDKARARSLGEKTISVVAPPDATLNAPTVVTMGKAGIEASVSPQAGHIEWTIAGGVITTGKDAATVTFTAGEGAALTLGVVVTNDAGDRESFQRDIRIVPAPVATIVTDAGPFTTGAEGLRAAVPWQPHSTFAWSVENGTITEGQGTESIVFAVGEPGRVRLAVVVTNEAGDAVEATGSLDAVSPPVAAIHTLRSAVTANTSGLTASVPEQDDSTFAWSVENGTITEGQGTATITYEAGEVGVLVISATVTNAAGSSDARSLEIGVVPAPDATIAAPVTVTAETSGLQASVPEQEGSSFAWSVDGGTILEGQGSSAITFMAHEPGTAVLSVTVANAAGDPAHGDATLVVVPAPVATISLAGGPFTEGTDGLRASVPAQDGSTYTWLVSGGAIDQGQGTPELVLAAGAPGVLEVSVTVTNAAGDEASSTESRTVVPAPNATITAVQFATEHVEGLEASVPAQENSTFTWSISGGTITSGEGTDRITFTAGGVGVLTLSVSVENVVSDTASGDKLIEIVAPPDATLTGPDGPLTAFKPYGAQVPEQPGATYNWQVSNGLLQGGQGTASIQFLAAASVTVQCTVTNAAGDSATEAATFSVISAPGAHFTAPTRTLKGQAGLVASIPSQENSTYAWSIHGGTIDSRTDGPEITFTAGFEDVLRLELVVTNAVGDTATRVRDVDVVWGYSTATGQMTTPRREAKAVTLHDGRVLIAGGRSLHDSLDTAETFSVQTESFTAARPMRHARSNHTMTLLRDGRVLVVGGTEHNAGPTYVHSRAEIFDSTTDTWSDTAWMRQARYNHTATLLADGRVLVAGGYGAGYLRIQTAEIFDPATETWTPAGSLLNPRENHNAVLMADGRVLISGSGTLGAYGPERTAEIFDPATGRWSQAAGGVLLPWGATLSPLPGGEFLLAGGTVAPGHFYETVQEAQIYDPVANAFYPVASMHGPRAHQVSVPLPGGRVFQAGGIVVVHEWLVVEQGTRTAELYDPPTDTFLRTKDLLEARVRSVAALLPDGRVLIAGGHGSDASDVRRTAEIFTYSAAQP